ncbi:type I pantothenate kinase [soil metagenome]
MSPHLSPYLDFSATEWAALRASTPMTLTSDDVEAIRGINVALSLVEVERVYLTLSRLLNLYVRASQALFSVTDTFLGKPTTPVPYVIGIAGSVAVGKSTSARVLQALLSRWPDHPRVDLVTTDGFLWPNDVLAGRGLMARKGFPESYDRKRLLEFVADVKSGSAEVGVPVYSHTVYDIVPGERRVIQQPDIVIVEGLNVLQGGGNGTYVSDYFDFAIYVDAHPDHVEQWYVDRFLTFRDTAFQDPANYFHQYASLTDPEAETEARAIWADINRPNLEENIAPTRDRATLILEKASDHTVKRIRLRRL